MVPELLTWRALKFFLDDLAYSPTIGSFGDSIFRSWPRGLSPMMLIVMPGNLQLSSHGAINLDVTKTRHLEQENVEYNGAT
jgi:hypothetical protein